MYKKLALTVTLFFTTVLAQAQHGSLKKVLDSNAGFFDVKDVEVKVLSEEEILVSDNKNSGSILLDWNDCSNNSENGNPTVLDTVDGRTIKEVNNDEHKSAVSIAKNHFSLDQVINTGKEVWQFIENNKPVVTASTQSANALPLGLKCWNQLEKWSPARVLTVATTYKNPYGITVVDLVYKLIYTPGGQINGVGRYITNATIQYKNLEVFWGFNVSANVEIPQVVNLGSSTDPVAGMQISVNWSIKTIVKHVQQTDSYFVYGDGRPVEPL